MGVNLKHKLILPIYRVAALQLNSFKNKILKLLKLMLQFVEKTNYKKYSKK